MTSYIFTLDYHEDFILRSLSDEKTQPENRIAMPTVKPVRDAKRQCIKTPQPTA
ncbi:MAG: hypothetical protein QXE01_02450 [Sulfolobales archaeon]